MKKVLFLLGGIFFLIPTGRGQVMLPQAFEQPLQRAFEKSKTLQNNALKKEENNLAQKNVKNKYFPRVSARGGYGYINNNLIIDLPTRTAPLTGKEFFQDKSRVGVSGQLLHGDVMAEGVIFSGLQIKNGLKALEQKSLGDSLLQMKDREDLIMDLVNSFDKMAYVKASEDLLRSSDKRLQKEEERVNKAIENGLAIPYDREKIKLARLQLESKGEELNASKALLLNKLIYLTGMTEEELNAVHYELSPFSTSMEGDVEQRFELQALQAYKEAGTYMLKKEKGTFLPQVGAFAGVSSTNVFNGSATLDLPYAPFNEIHPEGQMNRIGISPNWMAGVVVKWELFGGTERRNKVRQAALGIRQLDNKYQDAEEQLSLLLEQKQTLFQTANQQVRIGQQQEKMAHDNLQLAERQYALGLIPITELLHSETDYVDAARQRVESLIAQRQATLELLKAKGHLEEQIKYY